MKKFILPLFAAFAINAAAQTVESIAMDASALGLEKPQKGEDGKTVINDKILDKGTTIGESASLVITTGDADGTAPGNGHGWSAVTTHVSPYKFYQIGGAQIQADKETGVQGQSNGSQPTPLEEENAFGTFLQFNGDGSFFNIEAKNDGYVYVCNKMTGNKNYYVFAHMGDETVSLPIAYSVYGFGADWAGNEAASKALGNNDGVIKYSIEGKAAIVESIDGDELNIKDIYYGQSTIGTPISFFEGLESKNFMGVIKFPVTKGVTYAVMARGSKMSLGGVFFSDSELEIALFAPAQEATEDKEAVEAKTLVLAEGAQGTEQTALKGVKANMAAKKAAFKTFKNRQLVIVNDGKNYRVDGKIAK